MVEWCRSDSAIASIRLLLFTQKLYYCYSNGAHALELITFGCKSMVVVVVMVDFFAKYMEKDINRHENIVSTEVLMKFAVFHRDHKLYGLQYVRHDENILDISIKRWIWSVFVVVVDSIYYGCWMQPVYFLFTFCGFVLLRYKMPYMRSFQLLGRSCSAELSTTRVLSSSHFRYVFQFFLCCFVSLPPPLSFFSISSFLFIFLVFFSIFLVFSINFIDFLQFPRVFFIHEKLLELALKARFSNAMMIDKTNTSSEWKEIIQILLSGVWFIQSQLNSTHSNSFSFITSSWPRNLKTTSHVNHFTSMTMRNILASYENHILQSTFDDYYCCYIYYYYYYYMMLPLLLHICSPQMTINWVKSWINKIKEMHPHTKEQGSLKNEQKRSSFAQTVKCLLLFWWLCDVYVQHEFIKIHRKLPFNCIKCILVRSFRTAACKRQREEYF